MNRPARVLASAFVLFDFVSVLQAHPGHDDPDLTWDIDHLLAHPGATLLCFGVLGAGGYLAYRLARRSPEESTREQ